MLRSPLAGLTGRSMMLLVVTGRRTGRRYAVPVQYVRRGQELWVLVGHPERKSWWRNVTEERPVELWLAGKRHTGRALALSTVDEPTVAVPAARAYHAHFTGVARRAVVRPEPEVLVRIVLPDGDTGVRGAP